jgi:rfaE bifunctional protein kinase chain/domain
MTDTFSLSLGRAREIVDRFDDVSILVVGDVMLDHFVVGRVNRISPEAPVPVVEHDRDDYRAGGAANVAHNGRALGAAVHLVGVTGADEAGDRLRHVLSGHGISAEGLVRDPARCTTRKLRIVTDRNQQVARVDYETDEEVAGQVEAELRAHISRLTASVRVVVVSDYLKGTVTGDLVAHTVAACRDRGIPLLVDPKIPHLDYYRGATLVTPNHHEAEVATHLRVRNNDDAARAARVFRDRAACVDVLITRGEHGMTLLEGSVTTHFPSVAREVSDVTGAGDTVIATLALALAAGASMGEAAEIANHAAGVVVAKFGAATVSPA